MREATNGTHIMAEICLSESYCINLLMLSISVKVMFARFCFWGNLGREAPGSSLTGGTVM